MEWGKITLGEKYKITRGLFALFGKGVEKERKRVF